MFSSLSELSRHLSLVASWLVLCSTLTCPSAALMFRLTSATAWISLIATFREHFLYSHIFKQQTSVTCLENYSFHWLLARGNHCKFFTIMLSFSLYIRIEYCPTLVTLCHLLSRQSKKPSRPLTGDFKELKLHSFFYFSLFLSENAIILLNIWGHIISGVEFSFDVYCKECFH